MKQGIWGVDRITFRINGRDPQRFLNLASRHGVRLSHLRREEDGLSASAPGNSRVRIEQLAVQGGWRFSLLERRGPGRLAERIEAFLRVDGLRSIRRSYRAPELAAALGAPWRVETPAPFRVLAVARGEASRA